MQIIVNKDFSISQVEPSTVGQGSVNGAVISVFAPFSVGQYSAVKIYAELPNGEVLEPIAAFSIPSDSLGFGAWSVLVGGALTKYPGQVKIQLVFLARDYEVGDVTVESQPSTGIATFTVAEGITPVLPDEPDSNVYNDLFIKIGELTAKINTNDNDDKISKALINGIIGRVRLIQSAETKKFRYNVKIRYTDDLSYHNTVSFNMALYSDVPTDISGLHDLLLNACNGQPVLILDQVNPDSTVTPLAIEYGDDWYQFSVSYIDTDNNLRYITFTPNMEEITVESQVDLPLKLVEEESTARESADTALGQRITDDVAAVETRLGESMQTLISIESNARETADNEIKDLAVGIPTYDETTGKITFETLSGRYTTIDLILMSMLTNVRFDEANNEIVFSFRTHEGVESEVRVPLGDLTLPAWTTNVNTTNSEQLSVPPTTQAVKNAVSSEVSARQNADTALGTRINNEATSRGNADEAIKESAVKAPTLSNNVLIFKNLNDEEMTRITLPEGGGGGGSSGGSCSCYSVPIQEFEYNNDDPYSTLYRSFTFTEVAENTLKAFIHIAPPESVNCGGYPDMVISSDNPFGEEGAEEIYYAFDDVADSDYDDEFNVRISLNAPLTMTISYSAYSTPPSNWFIEITAKTDTREIWVYGQQMRAAY